MNAKTYLVAAIALNTVLLAFAVSFNGHLPRQSPAGGGTINSKAMGSTTESAKFGPVQEAVLPGASTNAPEILDLETGRSLPQEPLERFNSRADVIMAWIRSNRLDISCNVWATGAACVTYDMTVLAVDGKCWEKTTEDELLSNPALAPKAHSPRRLLVLGPNRPDTYMFRTGEGSLGLLRIVGLSPDGQGVKIRYKLIKSSKTSTPMSLSKS